ncbi:hypothetical protein SAMN04488544_3360 [Microlunatus sagamiharensis]|uniref:Uncharacterized protein n=1 Tax=Microlunatus sagamiharensis TaxID=546874 RepID=A0A1H2N5G2_9ACTN|nr:hypothetical protein [Microlunatus sagamiharensis]SDV00710.1 hypothetical protein SAMN04488544_3360 [Microlunatus sagamiharensis]
MAIDEAELDQYSDETRSRLKAAADAFATAIEQHTARLLELSGGSTQVHEVFGLNATVRRAAASWDDAVFDHTGTFPLAVDLDEDDEDDVLDDDEEEDLSSEVSVSVVSRWDLEVTSVEDVVAAGREAHRRNNPDESDQDARARIGDRGVGQALYALVHDFGEPWFEIPGLELAGAHRVYVARDEQLETTDDEDEDEDESLPIVIPGGEVLYRESW